MDGIKMGRYRFNHEEKKWEKLTADVPKSDWDIVIDDRLFEKLMYAKKVLRKNLDFPIIISGEVGAGKSNIARLCCRIISDENFHPKTHIVKNVKDVEPVFRNTKKYEGIILDEGASFLAATDTMKKETKWMQEVFNECRGQNRFIAVLAPDFHTIKQDIAVGRTNGLIRVYFDKRSGARGPFAFYGKKKKAQAYAIAKKEHGIYRKVRPNFRGTAGEDKTYTKEYLEVKDATFNDLLSSGPVKKQDDKPKPRTEGQITQDIELNYVLKWKEAGKTNKEIAQLLGKSEKTIEGKITKYNKSKKEGENTVKPLIS